MFGSNEIVSRIPAGVNTPDKSSYIAGSRRDGEEALEGGAFGEADGVVDGVAGAGDLSQGPRTLRCSSSGPDRKVLFDPDKNRFLKFDAFLDHAREPFLNALGPM